MKKNLVFLICLVFIFTSCKKKAAVTPTPVNTISATVDGVNMNFNINISAYFLNTPLAGGSSTLAIQGSTAPSAPAAGVGISLTSSNASSIIKGTYTIASSNNNPPVWTDLRYGYYDPSSSGPDQPYISTGAYPYTITITSISSTNVQGTFSGTLPYSQGGTTTKTVTNGKFNVNIN